jgi:hypothetical protein
MMGSLIPARVAAQRLGCSEIVLQEVAYSNRLSITVATATHTWWIPEDALDAYQLASRSATIRRDDSRSQDQGDSRQ